MATYQANIPAPLSLEGDIPSNWSKFHKSFQIFLGATKRELAKSAIDRLNAQEKKEYYCDLGKLLLNIAGEEAATVSSTFGLSEEDEYDYLKLVEKFKQYAAPEANETYVRFIFNRTRQAEGESFDHFLTEARKNIKNCGFKDLENSLLRDRIVEGIRDKRLQQALLKNSKLDLDAAINECRAAEISKKYAQKMQETQEVTEVNAIRFHTKKKGNKFNNTNHKPRTEEGNTNPSEKCNRCGYPRHPYARCPAVGRTCAKCGKQNHFASMCDPSKFAIRTHEIRTQEENSQDSDSEGYQIVFSDCLNTVETRVIEVDNIDVKKEYRQKVKVEGTILNFKLDPGSPYSILPQEIFESLKTNKSLGASNIFIKPYGENTPLIATLGKVFLRCRAGGQEHDVEFLITDDKDRSLFGLRDCEKFGMIKRTILEVDSIELPQAKEDFIKSYEEVFKGIGSFPGTHVILTRPDAQQVIRPALRRPKVINDKLVPALGKLEKAGIIAKVDQLTIDSWVSNIVVVTKPSGDIRICLDPVDLNRAIIKEPYLIPTIDEISEQLCHQKYYSVFDLKDGFYHIVLQEESSYKCCFATPVGIYRFKRCPFGLSCAPELFQKLNDRVFGDLKNTIRYFDDILVYGRTEEEHDQAVLAVIQRAQAAGVRFNPKKVQYRQKSVRYVGHVFSEEGKGLDPDRVSATLELEAPRDKEGLQRVLGTFNYCRDFIPQMSTLTENMRRLLKKDTVWQWTEVHNNEFEKLKTIMSTAPVLANFDPNKKIIIQCDASQSGLGCCLLQDGHPVAFASRTLNTSERNYSVSEKELLGCTFGLEDFHNFVFGYPIEIQTDHLPLVPMINKEIYKLGSKTLQRLRLKMLKYDITMVHVPGKLMYMSDMFSRNTKKVAPEDESMIEMVHSLSMSLPINDKLKDELITATAKDKTLQKVVKHIREGWPRHLGQVADAVVPYFKVRHDLFVEEEIVLLNDEGNCRIVVPSATRRAVLKLIHAGHMGIGKCLSRAVEICFWPKMQEHVEEYVKTCSVCSKFQPKPAKHPLKQHPQPSLMWQRVSMDIASYGRQDFLVIYDSYSKWLEIQKLADKSAASVVDVCRTVFSTHGIPQYLLCDNNPFNAFVFKRFAKELNMQIIYSSPHHHQSNGRAEKGVAIAKSMIKKAAEERADFREALMEYRNTKIASMGYSPAQLLFSRKLRTVLPASVEDLKPSVPRNVADRLDAQAARTKEWFDRTAPRPECCFRPGQQVQVSLGEKGHTWKPATIISKCPEPRSYMVEFLDGSQLRRSTVHLRPRRANQRDDDRDNMECELLSEMQSRSQPAQTDRSETPMQREMPSGQSPNGSTSGEEDGPRYQLIVPSWLYDIPEVKGVSPYITRYGCSIKPICK